MIVPTTGQDTYSHLLGIHAFVNVGDHYMVPGSLSAASFWVGLRQEIYIAVITQQPVKVSLDHFVVDRSFELADDYTWSNRAIVLLADVLNYCFGENSFTTGRWVALDEACRKWSATRPMSFNPFFYRARSSPQAFPEIWHGSSCHGRCRCAYHRLILKNVGLRSCSHRDSAPYPCTIIPNSV